MINELTVAIHFGPTEVSFYERWRRNVNCFRASSTDFALVLIVFTHLYVP